MTATRPRRTQEERSAQSRVHLIRTAAADRAEVSRGALTHRFWSSKDLVVRAAERTLKKATSAANPVRLGVSGTGSTRCVAPRGSISGGAEVP